jgi:hypothetical protein
MTSTEPPMDKGQIIPEFRHGRIDYHGQPVPEAIYRFMKEIQEKKVKKHE